MIFVNEALNGFFDRWSESAEILRERERHSAVFFDRLPGGKRTEDEVFFCILGGNR